MKFFLTKVRWFVDHALVNLVIVLILFFTNLAEVSETLLDDIFGFHFRGVHGVLLFALFAVIKQVAALFDAVDKAKSPSKAEG